MFGGQNRIDEAEMGRAVRVTQVENNTATRTRSACHEMGVFVLQKNEE